MGGQHWQEILKVAFGGRPVIVVGGVRRAELVYAARALGAPWVGDLGPSEPDLGSDVTATFDEEWRARLDAIDPSREALVLGHNFHPYRTFGSRRFVGRRRVRWRVFEDKPAMWELLASTGRDVGPWQVVPAAAQALSEASRDLDEGIGTVWAGDHRDGERSGGEHVRVVATSAQAAAAAVYFASNSDRVRVMPLLGGTPCSIHCFVSAEEIAPMRPARVDTHLDLDTGIFSYRGADWTWRPSARLVASAQRFASQAATLMRDHADYRGVFCVDGVAVGEVFHPTEVNSRWGASLTQFASTRPEFALRFIHGFLADRHDADWQLGALVREVGSD